MAKGEPRRIADPVIVTAPASPIDGAEANRSLARVAASSGDLLGRLHAIWGLGQLARIQLDGKQLGLWDVLGPLLDDRQAEVRAQAARVLGEAREPKSFDRLVARLDDASPRVRSFAAIALGKLGRPEAVGPLLAMLRADGGKDAVLRHAAVMGLVGSASDRPGGAEACGRRCLDVGADGRPAGDASARRSRDRPVPQGRRSSAGARGRAGDQRRADRRRDAGAGRAAVDVGLRRCRWCIACSTPTCGGATPRTPSRWPPRPPRPACPPRCASRRWRCSANGRARRVATR